MSDLSEQINTALESLNHKDKGFEHWHNREEWVKDVPGFEGFGPHCAMQIVKVLRKVYRRQAGSSLPETPQEALDRTEAICKEKLGALCMSAFADGVQIGHGITSPVKKFNFFKKLDQVFEHEGFRSESDLFAMTVEMDYEASEAIHRYFHAAATFIAASSGFMTAKDKHTLNRVWDLWALSANSACNGLFIAGVRVGQEWAKQDAEKKELDILSGILSASEKGNDDGE